MYFIVHQLHHVLVTRHDVHGAACLRRFASQRSNHVICFEASHPQHRNAIGLQRPPDIRNLLRQIFRHLLAIGLVSLVFDFCEGLSFNVELPDGGDAVGLLVTKRSPRHVKYGSQIVR